MILRKKQTNKQKINIYLFLLTKGQFCSKIRNFPEIADYHNSGTEYSRDMKFVSKCVVLDTLPYSTYNSILTKSGFMPFLEMSSSFICNFKRKKSKKKRKERTTLVAAASLFLQKLTIKKYRYIP